MKHHWHVQKAYINSPWFLSSASAVNKDTYVSSERQTIQALLQSDCVTGAHAENEGDSITLVLQLLVTSHAKV